VADALLGQAGLLFFAAELPLKALHRCQKPRCFWLAIHHGAGSFPIILSGLLRFSSAGAARTGAVLETFPAVSSDLDAPLLVSKKQSASFSL
jgi:hypothetical protein